ncbi:hypothetical protein B296_00020777 [Ensete ventricosum]|uniref:DUF834 domain-containing protein n=1 Tax=Ensete ventricosum TaxID=4639 RepID=A0A427A313_ENSVE|nr:hypothetical protein B296_00020777 [Ensete ventricosum]
MDDCCRKLQGVQRQGRKKGQRSGSRLEEAVAAAGGRCWDGKEQLQKHGCGRGKKKQRRPMLELSAEEIATATRARRRGGREGTEGKQSLLAIVEGWPQEKRGRADLARKIDDREEAGNNAVGKGRGPRLLRLPGLQGHMRAAATAGCGSGMRGICGFAGEERKMMVGGCGKEQDVYGERNRGATTDGEEGDEFADHVQRKGCVEVDAGGNESSGYAVVCR